MGGVWNVRTSAPMRKSRPVRRIFAESARSGVGAGSGTTEHGANAATWKNPDPPYQNHTLPWALGAGLSHLDFSDSASFAMPATELTGSEGSRRPIRLSPAFRASTSPPRLRPAAPASASSSGSRDRCPSGREGRPLPWSRPEPGGAASPPPGASAPSRGTVPERAFRREAGSGLRAPLPWSLASRRPSRRSAGRTAIQILQCAGIVADGRLADPDALVAPVQVVGPQHLPGDVRDPPCGAGHRLFSRESCRRAETKEFFPNVIALVMGVHLEFMFSGDS